MLKNSKLKGWFVRYDSIDGDETFKSEKIIADTKANALIIFVDKYYNLINKTLGIIHIVDKPINILD